MSLIHKNINPQKIYQKFIWLFIYKYIKKLFNIYSFLMASAYYLVYKIKAYASFRFLFDEHYGI